MRATSMVSVRVSERVGTEAINLPVVVSTTRIDTWAYTSRADDSHPMSA